MVESRAVTMMNMSNATGKRNLRYAIVAVIIIAIIAGGVYYQSTLSSAATTTSMMSETSSMTSETSMAPVSLVGAGATFPQPLIQKWTVEYHNLYPSITISYNGIGSGGGIQQITAKTIDFGASDAPLTGDQKSHCAGCIMIPISMTAVTIAYNVPGLGSG